MHYAYVQRNQKSVHAKSGYDTLISELIVKEETEFSPTKLILLGCLASAFGILSGIFVMPEGSGYIAVSFAALPLVMPLHEYFFRREEETLETGFGVYLSLFIGMLIAFTIFSGIKGGVLEAQANVITGGFTSTGPFLGILLNNTTVFILTMTVSTVLGSAGAFVLTWNASVMGKFFGEKLNDGVLLSGCDASPGLICYLPHAVFEITGFVAAGIAGTLISASIVNRNMTRDYWKRISTIVIVGLCYILTGAVIETKSLVVSLPFILTSSLATYYAFTDSKTLSKITPPVRYNVDDG